MEIKVTVSETKGPGYGKFTFPSKYGHNGSKGMYTREKEPKQIHGDSDYYSKVIYDFGEFSDEELRLIVNEFLV